MGELDLTAIKQAIVDFIKADSELFDETGASGEKFRSVDIGMLEQKNYLSLPMPYCRITKGPRIDVDKPYHGDIETTHTSGYHDIFFRLIVVAQEKDTKTVEITLDQIHKNLKERLKSDFTFNGAVKWSYPGVTEPLGGGIFEGKAVDGFVILLQCVVITTS